MSNKGCHNNSNLNLLENGVIIRDELKIANTFNDVYVNIVQNISGKSIGNISIIDSSKPHDSDNEINSIIEKYKEHPSIELIKVNLPEPHTFAFEKASKDGISKRIKGLKSTTATGIDTIPPKLVKMAGDIIAEPLTNLINSTLIDSHSFPLREKVATVTPIFKKCDKLSKKELQAYQCIKCVFKGF